MTGEINSLRLRRALTEIAEEGVPGGMDLWPKVSGLLKSKRGRLPVFRLAWGVPIVVIIAVFGVAAVAVAPRMIDDLNSILTNEHGDDAELGAPLELGLTETVEGVRVDLDSVRISKLTGVDGVVHEGYVAIEWTVFREPGHDVRNGERLLDNRGRVLPEMTGFAQTDRTSEIFSNDVPPNARIFAYLFDLAGAQVDGDELRLTMEFPLSRRLLPEPAAEPAPVPTPVWLTREDGSVYGAVLPATPPAQTQPVGVISFDFTVPVEGGLSEPDPDSGSPHHRPDYSKLLQPTPPAR